MRNSVCGGITMMLNISPSPSSMLSDCFSANTRKSPPDAEYCMASPSAHSAAITSSTPRGRSSTLRIHF